LTVPLAEFQDDFPDLCRRLLVSRRSGRIGQAYLFVGDSPAWLERFVTAWAQVRACQTPRPDGDACGSCETCVRLAHRTYPERVDLVPESKTRLILVEAMRTFDSRLNLSTDAAHPKIGVIAEADCMNNEAQNAFLKTLEEPPPHTLLLLYSTQPRLLLSTIRSRCQIVPLLHNRADYTDLRQRGLFTLLAPLRRQAGAAVGLRTSAQLQAIFTQLGEEAESTVGSATDERLADILESDRGLGKRLAEQRSARVAAEYVRRRREVEDGMQAWFLQQRLRAAGVRADLLPHPELLDDLPETLRNAPPPAAADADQDLRFVADLLRALRASLNEALALDAFCLCVSARTPAPQKNLRRA
jgi:DNA polymerase III subunit delta'